MGADADGRFRGVAAEIIGTDTGQNHADPTIGTVMLTVPEKIQPVTVRYAWRSWGPAPLFNADALPAVPFTHHLA